MIHRTKKHFELLDAIFSFIIHVGERSYPFSWICMSYVELNHPSNRQMAVIIVIGMLLLIFLSLLVFTV